MAHLVEALCYKPERRGFDSRWRHCNFPLTQCFRPNYGLGVDSAPNRNEYGKDKAIPLQAWTGPEGSRSLRLPDFKTIGT